jgi:hypothetical protein
MANSYSDWQTFPLADQTGADPDPDKPYLQAAQAAQAPILSADPDPDKPYLQAAQAIEGTTPTYNLNLQMGRTRYVQEMQDNPDLRRKLMASMNAEVGSQGPDAQRAYLETVMNRASARNKSLDFTISPQSHYYPKTTTDKLGATFSIEQQAKFNPLIDSVLQGSNLTSYATGNDSGQVHSGGAPIHFQSQGERFVLEKVGADQKWAQGHQLIAQQTPTPAPTQASMSLVQGEKFAPIAIMQPPPVTKAPALAMPALPPLAPPQVNQQQLIAEARARIKLPQL